MSKQPNMATTDAEPINGHTAASGDACDWLESLEGDEWADACAEICRALEAQGGAQ